MTPDDVTPESRPLTRRARNGRARDADHVRTPVLPFGDAPAPASTPVITSVDELPPAPQIDFHFDADELAQWTDETRTATAFTWLDPDDVAETTRPADLDAGATEQAGSDLFADARFRPGILTARWLAPIGTLVTLAVAYGATMMLWPLTAVAPTVQAVEFETSPSSSASLSFPGVGSAAVSVAGVSASASTAEPASIASVTKVVTSLMVLDELPLQLGEQGPEYAFTYGDTVDYWNYRRANQSALDVPVDGVLTEYQLLQGTLLGSANNYIDFLANELWGSDRQFAAAAETWLTERGLTDITIVTPSGFDERNVATPEALLRLADTAMRNPVFAEIVGTTTVELPGAGLVTNTNGMLADPGVVGIKTGTLVGWSLLTAKDVTIDDTTVRLYAAVLNQDDNDQRLAVTRQLFDEVEAALNDAAPIVSAGTVVGEVTAQWGERVDVVTDADAEVVLWNGAAGTTNVAFDFDEQQAEGDVIGTLTATGPIDSAEIGVSLAEELNGPTPLWRLTHPLDLLGISN